MIISEQVPDFGFSTELNQAHEIFGEKLGIVAYVEGFEDVRFWTKEFQKLNIEINAVEISSIASANGKTAILSAVKNKRIMLGEKLLICIDSDYDYLLSKDIDIYDDHFCFQTYTYSIENYYYNPVGLTELCFEAACTYQGKKDHLELLLLAWSKYIYSCFILYLIENKTQQLDFIKASLKQLTLENLYATPNETHATTNEQKKKFTDKGLTPQNVFLYFRGHDLETAIKKLAEEFVEQLSHQKKADISSTHKSNAAVFIKEYFNKRREIKTLTESRHPHPQNPCYRLLQSDIKAYYLIITL